MGLGDGVFSTFNYYSKYPLIDEWFPGEGRVSGVYARRLGGSRVSGCAQPSGGGRGVSAHAHSVGVSQARGEAAVQRADRQHLLKVMLGKRSGHVRRGRSTG